MQAISLSSENWLDLGSEESGQGPGDHGHAHPHAHPDGSVSGGWHTHGHGAGHQHNATGPEGWGSGGDAGELASDAAAVELSDIDPLANATPEEWAMVWDAVAEVSEEDGWAMAGAGALAGRIAALPGDELAELAAGGGYPDDLAPGTPFSAWQDGLDDRQFGAIHEESRAFANQDGGQLGYLREAYQLDRALANSTMREHVRQAQDQAEVTRRSGARHRRPTDEIALANGLARYAEGTYLPGQLLDLAGDPDAEALLEAGPEASQYDVMAEMFYQLGSRRDLPPARQRRQPLPPVGGLARTIGLR